MSRQHIDEINKRNIKQITLTILAQVSIWSNRLETMNEQCECYELASENQIKNSS